MLELTTVGRRSGLPRSVMLPSPVQENEAWVIVASRGGSDRHPAWLLNLRDHPDVDVILQGKVKQRMRARIADVRRADAAMAAGHLRVQGLCRIPTED